MIRCTCRINKRKKGYDSDAENNLTYTITRR